MVPRAPCASQAEDTFDSVPTPMLNAKYTPNKALHPYVAQGAPRVNADVWDQSKMKCIAIHFVFWIVLAAASHAATVSGVITNRHGFGIHDILVTATQAGDSNHIVTTNAGYGGPYSIELPEGSWLLELDPVQLGEWGYQPFVAEIDVVGSGPIVTNLVPLPIEPPIPPALSLRVSGDRWNLLVDGGGDRMFRVDQSVDLISWTPWGSNCTDNGEIEFGSRMLGIYSNRCHFRVVVTE